MGRFRILKKLLMATVWPALAGILISIALFYTEESVDKHQAILISLYSKENQITSHFETTLLLWMMPTSTEEQKDFRLNLLGQYSRLLDKQAIEVEFISQGKSLAPIDDLNKEFANSSRTTNSEEYFAKVKSADKQIEVYVSDTRQKLSRLQTLKNFLLALLLITEVITIAFSVRENRKK